MSAQLEKICRHLFDEGEFLSPYGLRALSAYHRDHPYVLDVEGQQSTIDYEPAESTTAMFGGNSNWRGPIWFPLNYLIVSVLERYYLFFGDDVTVEYPAGSGHQLNFDQITCDLRDRLISIFLVGPDGRRPCFGGVDKLQHDPAWKDNLLFNEYFHGDNAAGLGASHQTGWTGVVADLIRRRWGTVPSLRDLRECSPPCLPSSNTARPGSITGGQVTTGLPGSPFPLGATLHRDSGHGGGTNFAVASEVAAGLTLCLFDAAGHETQVPMLDYDAGVWHTFVPGVTAGQAYGFRAQGPYDPAQGIRCNPAKLLLDPYARAVTGTVTDNPDVLGYVGGNPDTPSDTDSASDVPRSVVVDPAYGWRDSGPLRRPYADTVIYEVHVKGFTMQHPGVPPALRGTYAGLAHEAATSHLTQLGRHRGRTAAGARVRPGGLPDRPRA